MLSLHVTLDFPMGEPQRVCEVCFKTHALPGTGIETHFDKYGPDTAPVIIIIHSEGGNRQSISSLVKELSHVYKVIAPDIPGAGSRSKEKFTFDASVKMVVDLIGAQVSSGSAFLIGHNLGGVVAAEVAAKHCNLCSGLVCIGLGAESATTQLISKATKLLPNSNPLGASNSGDLFKSLKMYHGPKMVIGGTKEMKKLTASQTNNDVGKSDLKMEIVTPWDSNIEEIFKKIHDILWKFLAEVGW